MSILKVKYILWLSILAGICFLCTTGCSKTSKATLFQSEIDSVGIYWVPDLREGIYEAELVNQGGNLVLKGETDVSEAKAGIINILNKKRIIFADSLKLLPDANEIKNPWGLVNVSVCNIRLFATFDAEMVTQALMGTPVRILKKDNDWFLIQTPDMYLGWVDSDALKTMSKTEYSEWKTSPRLFYIAKTGDVFTDPSGQKVISDIVAGCIVALKDNSKGLYEVILPDGRKGYIPSEKAIFLDSLTIKHYFKPENLVTTAESFMGIPYLWGGTSSKGFDCSGFVKTIYFLNGIILSRDASQQFQYGIRIRRASFPDSLKKGDLLFFGSVERGRPRPTHVGMYIGDSEFIHASGMVKINSLDSTRANFSRFRRNSFLGIRRLKGAKEGPGIKPVLSHGWYY